MLDRYKSTQCIGHLFGHGCKRKTKATTDRLIQRKLKLYRRKSAATVKVEVESGRRILSQVDTI